MPSEPEMEHYLRLAGWRQAKLYPQNWVLPFDATGMTVHRLAKAVDIQRERDKATILALQERLAIVS